MTKLQKKKIGRLNMKKEIKELIKQYNDLGEKIEDTRHMYVQKIYFTAKDKFQQIQKEEELLKMDFLFEKKDS